VGEALSFRVRIFKPAGCTRVLQKLDLAYERGYRRILLHGLGGTGKTKAALYFARNKFKVEPLYILLPCTPEDAYHFYCFVKTLKSNSHNKVVVIVDELEKIVNREVIGWLCKTLELDPHLVIGITNEPAYVRKTLHSIWRRFTISGVLVYAPPANYAERLHIVYASAKKLKIKILKEDATRIAKILEGYNFMETTHLFDIAIKQKGKVNYEIIEKFVKEGVVQPSNTPIDEEKYLNDLHDISKWDIDQKLY